MLSVDEKNYIQKISEGKKVNIKPYSPKIEGIASQVIKPIKRACPDLKVVHMGASGLRISGQGDIDIYAFADPGDFSKYMDRVIEILGEPVSKKYDSIDWEFSREGYGIEFYLTDPKSPPMGRQIAVFHKLRENSDLLNKYKLLKESFNGKSFRDYQRAKYEFYHKILD